MTTRTTIPAHPNNYRRGRRGETRFGLNVKPGTICAITLHDMESPEKLSTAEDVGRYFARGDIRPSSAHKLFDADSVVRSVNDADEAYHAPPASRWAIGYEQAGVARQTAAEWNDPYSRAMIQIVAAEAAADCKLYRIPVRLLDAGDLKAGHIAGIHDHNAASKAFGLSDHWDVGPNYPFGDFMRMVENGAHTVAPPPSTSVLRLGGPVKGEPVAFFGDMSNILAKAGFALNAHGKPSYVQVPIPTNKERRKLCTFNGALHARAEEIQRFAGVLWDLNPDPRKGKRPVVDGIVGDQTTSFIAYAIPLALAKLKAKS